MPAAFCQTRRTPDLDTGKAVRCLGQDFVSSDKADALSIAIVPGDGFDFFNFGSTIRGEDKKPTKHSVYEIGSVTKFFTSLLLAHAVQEGRIGLQDDIRRYLPGEYRNLSFGGLPIRVIDLADTTSALPDNLPNFKEVTANVPQELRFAVDYSTSSIADACGGRVSFNSGEGSSVCDQRSVTLEA
jgi:D-alanyl-D-alanine-carboxypeptidase/D-alanyl-D-alanine-endopeptidase